MYGSGGDVFYGDMEATRAGGDQRLPSLRLNLPRHPGLAGEQDVVWLDGEGMEASTSSGVPPSKPFPPTTLNFILL